MTPVTIQAAADACGISRQAFHKAVMSGRIRSCGNNERGWALYDIEECKRGLMENSHPGNQAAGRSQQKHADHSADFFEPPDNSKAGVELKRNKVKLRKEEYALAVIEGKLTDAEKAERENERRASEEREAILNIPDRYADEMAGKFNVPRREMFDALMSVMKRHLQERCTSRVDVS